MRDPGLYRKQAIEELHNKDEYQEAVRILTPISWLYLIVFCILFTTGILWLFLGKITTQVSGQGVILSRDAQIVSVMSPENGGFVQKMQATPGKMIRKGELIATLTSPEITVEVEAMKRQLLTEKQKLGELEALAKKEILLRQSETEESRKKLTNVMTTLETKKAHLSGLLEVQEKAFKQGIISLLEISGTRVDYLDAVEDITRNENAINELAKELNDYTESWKVKLREQQNKVLQTEFSLHKLEGRLALDKNIYSPTDGTIFTNYASTGDYLAKNSKLTDIITAGNTLEVLAFVDAQDGKKLEPGMEAKVFPKHIESLEYGGITGTVYFVSEMPVGEQSIESALESKTFVDRFLKRGPVFEVRIRLHKNRNNYSGYQWTTSSGPQEKLSLGAVTDVSIIVKKNTPISIVIPVMKSAKNWLVNTDG